MNDLRNSVQVVGDPWKISPYYEQAEGMIQIFWNPSTIFRRQFDRLNLESVIELACGHGRHAEQIAARCGRLTLMDIHEDNISFCRERLKGHANVQFVLNSGFDFRPVEDSSTTAIFCYDAMVHFSPDIVESYLLDARRVLRPGGMALLHHSNYSAPLDQHYGLNPHARNHMTEQLFRELVGKSDLKIVDTVAIAWGHDQELDRVSLLRRDP